MEDCYYLDEYGSFKIDKYENLDILYGQLECLVKEKIKLTEIYYPYIMASTPDKYLRKIKIALNAERKGLKYLRTTEKYNNHDYLIIVFHPNYQEEAVLFNYILQKYHKLHEQEFNPIDYILNELRGFGKEYNKRFYMAQYFNKIIEKELPTNVKKIMSNPDLTMKEKYMSKYRLAEKHDDFEYFNKRYKEVEEKAGKILKEIKKSQNFEKYVKTQKTYPFKFSIKNSVGNNPFYKQIEPAVKKYAQLHKDY